MKRLIVLFIQLSFLQSCSVDRYSLNSKYELIQYSGLNIGIEAIESASVAIHDNKVFITGGYRPDGNRSSNYWVSDDLPRFMGPYNMGIPERNGHCSVSFNGNLYLMGGGAKTSYFNDVYVYSNEKFEFLQNAPWGGRSFFGCTTFNNGVIVFGGNGELGAFGDTWYTDNFSDWRLISNSFPNRGMFSFFNKNNKIIVVGGGEYNVGYPDNIKKDFENIIISNDAIHWEIVEGAKYPPIRFSGFGVLEDIYLTVGGFSKKDQELSALNLKDIYFSGDAIEWEKFPEVSQFRARHAPITFTKGNQFFILNGNDGRIYSDFFIVSPK